MSDHPEITLVKGTIHNPGEPRHFMRVAPATGQRWAAIGDVSLARSDEAVVVKEVGLDLYDHVTYFPRADVNMDALVRTDKTTHCPLKGDTEYFDVIVDGERIADAAWSYVETIDEATELRNLVAFDANTVTVG